MRGKDIIMFDLKLSYLCDCDPDELAPIKEALLSGMEIADLMVKFEDWYITDTAIIETAIDLGWDLEAAMKAEWIEEQLNNCLSYDGESTESIRCVLCNRAYEFICERLEEIKESNEAFASVMEQLRLETQVEALATESRS